MKLVRQLVPRAVRHGISAQLARVHAGRLSSDLGRLAAGRDTIVVGPWLGEVGFELLYWVPFLRWFATTFHVAPERLLIVSRGGTASWYRPFAAGYRDIFDYLTPEEFRRRHDERVAANGEQKQTQVLAFERQVLRELTTDVHSRSMLHPSTMYGLFNPFWWGHVDEEWVHRFAKYQPLTAEHVGPHCLAERRGWQRPAYTAVKFYFNDCFPDTPRESRVRAPRAAGAGRARSGRVAGDRICVSTITRATRPSRSASARCRTTCIRGRTSRCRRRSSPVPRRSWAPMAASRIWRRFSACDRRRTSPTPTATRRGTC